MVIRKMELFTKAGIAEVCSKENIIDSVYSAFNVQDSFAILVDRTTSEMLQCVNSNGQITVRFQNDKKRIMQSANFHLKILNTFLIYF